MADRTVRAIFEARTDQAQKGLRALSKDVDKAGKDVEGLTKDLKTLDKQSVTPKIDLSIDKAKKSVSDLTIYLGQLRTMEVTPEVTADISKAQRALREAKSELKDLEGAKAELQVAVTANTDDVESKLYNLKSVGKDAGDGIGENISAGLVNAVTSAGVAIAVDDALEDSVGKSGKNAGTAAGAGVVSGIVDALRSIPIAGAVVGIGAALSAGLFLAIKDGLSVEAERDFFSAQTGLDEATAARFGRAAGEAYANAWGDSVAGNLDDARLAMQAGLIDSSATDAEIENVIAKLEGIKDLFNFDIADSVRGVGNLMKSGLVKDANQAFDLIVAASQKVQSDDLLDTLNEYSTQFKTLGLTAEQAFGLIVQGAKAGARDTDNIADTLKEMGLRIREGLKPASDALKSLGLDSGEIIKAFQEGGPKAVAAMDKVFDALRVLEEKGGNTQAVIAALFGGPGEDLGAALYALDLDSVAEALGGVEGAAGAADRALKTMSDNDASKIESAMRNIEVAANGIKGALAEAFGDQIAGAADWVTKNRAPLMQFFLDVINGTIDIAEGFANFGATALDAIADIADAFAGLIDSLPDWLVNGDTSAEGLRSLADSSRTAAEEIRTNVPAALEEARDKINTWAGPELLKARVHDATVAMTDDLKGFMESVTRDQLTITINGDTVDAEEALATLVDNINEEDGTVLINGDSVPAEDALDTLLDLIRSGEEDVSVGADTAPANRQLQTFKGKVSISEASMSINADDAAAKRKLAALTGKDYYATVRVNLVSNRISTPGTGGQHEGGWIGKGLYSGGWVPGSDPGYDNVLWPLNSGGRTLAQPLAGGEFVVNSKDSAVWGPLLEWINGGGRPVQTFNETSNAPIYIDKVVGLTVDEVERDAARRRRRDSLSPSRQGG